ELVLTFLTLFLVLGAGLFTAYRVLRMPAPAPGELISVAQQAVRDAIPSKYTLSFGAAEETQITATEDRYTVSGRVIAMPQLGAPESYLFTCDLSRFNGRRWRPAKLTLTPQY